jgi:translation initiation factor IF-2
VRIDNVISVGQLAHEMAIKSSVIIKFLMGQDMMATQNELLEFDIAKLVAAEFDYEVINAGFQEENYLQHFGEEEDGEDLEARPPVVTVMGHVDHGKTTLLDAIRNAKVASGEAGGITQHIGAYQVEWSENPITFLDTPGHAAFSSMRARGAQVTDLVVLVVAVDDGVQPQTAEAVSHANAAGVPIVVAINKMDKPGANADAIKQRLGEFGLVPEEWGGETLMVPVSALTGDGIDELLETILLQSEVLDLSANPDRFAEGIVIEAKMERGRGPIATVLVQKGTLKRGDHVVLGAVHGRVRSLTNDRGKTVKEAGPSMPVEVFGLSDLPQTGDSLDVLETDKKARKLAEHRAENRRLAALGGTTRKSAEEMLAGLGREEKKTVNVVIKADVQGSLEAVRAAVEALEVTGCQVRVLHAAVGNVSESDVHLLAADEGLLLGFNVKVDSRARRTADEAGVRPELFKVIYQLLDRVEGALKGMLEPVYEEVHQGSAEVRAMFTISRIGTIAGCIVQEGKVGRNHGARLFRGSKLIWEGRIGSLKRFKDDVREVSSGYECGISLDGYNEVKEGDVIQTFAMVEVAVD